MAWKRYKPGEIVNKLREVDIALWAGKTVEEACPVDRVPGGGLSAGGLSFQMDRFGGQVRERRGLGGLPGIEAPEKNPQMVGTGL